MLAAGESVPTPESRSKQPVVGSARMVTDAKCVENLAGLSAVWGLQPSSRASGRGQRGVADASTAAETTVHHKGTKIVSYLGPDRFDLQFATMKVAQDMQTSSMLSTLRLRRFVWCLVGAAGVRPFFTFLDEPGTILAWADVDWSGDAMTCMSTSAGAVQLESHEIEAWSVVQQVVSFSSAESETYAIEASKVDRWETQDHRWKQDRRIGAYPETRAEDAAERTIRAVAKVPHTIDSINKEATCTRPALKNPRSRSREPPDKKTLGLDTLENAKESPSDLDTRVLGSVRTER